MAFDRKMEQLSADETPQVMHRGELCATFVIYNSFLHFLSTLCHLPHCIFARKLCRVRNFIVIKQKKFKMMKMDLQLCNAQHYN
jgi:hypothetical protein